MSVKCPFCGRGFGDETARYQHAKTVHRGKKLSDITPEALKERDRARQQQARPEPEESFAEMAIEAEQLRAAGLPVPEDIAWLLP